MTIVYDSNCVSKTVAGVTTTYLVDTLNLTGYPQVVNENITGGAADNREQKHSYIYGLELISQTRNYQASFNDFTPGGASVSHLSAAISLQTDDLPFISWP
ncbi:MAG: hypothetical protein ACRD51_06655 [Candidatus Acidiferrum sp.]